MLPLLNLFVALALATVLYVCAMAVAADIFKVAVRKVVIGWGPAIFSFGRWTLKALPFGGMVQMRDTREEPEAGHRDTIPADAMNAQSRLVQVAIALAAPLAPALLAIALRGGDGLWNVCTGFVQILQGAFDHHVAHELNTL